jgi:hypothetical protein
MDRVRIVVLAAFAAAVVGVYLMAPDDGLFARTPTMVLLAVLLWFANLWMSSRHKGGATSGLDVAASPAHARPPSSDSARGRRPGHFDADTDAGPRAVTAGDVSSPGAAATSAIDLSEAPDLPASWPPPAVQVPRVFQVSSTEALVIDLRSGAEPEPRTEMQPTATPPSDVGLPAPLPEDRMPASSLGARHGGEDDPWIAFAAAMFRDD